ncbi:MULTISPECIES: acyltransferase family protein [unclassified Lentimicrobium]|uniref:acyltransferase family protein n=1 Tax=unclassified Lentimicrobium TaxID=2677434 RepID=UPI001C12F8D2|nr:MULTISPECIES: acyltransferase family protein [unclassified Lentimicrobium]
MERRHDIDWLRVIAIGLLIIYHTAIGFQPWGVFIQFIQNNTFLEWIWYPMSMLNIWRIPLLFFVSGMGIAFAMRNRNLKQLFLDRTIRILMPFVFGVIAIVPIHVFIWQDYYSQELSYAPHAAHLWFLGFIYIYVFLFSSIFYYMDKNRNSKFPEKLNTIFKNPLSLLLVALTFVIESVLVNPEMYTFYAMSLHGFIMGGLAFLWGFTFVMSGSNIWHMLKKWKYIFLIFANVLFVIRLSIYDLESPNILMSLETVFWTSSVFGFANQYFNRPSKSLSYLSQAVYPVYIIHMIMQYAISYYIFPLEISAFIKYLLVFFITFLASFMVYELVLRRVKFLRPLFGMKIIL